MLQHSAEREPVDGQVARSIQLGQVLSNQPLCREHYRLTFRLPELGTAYPGQFVHLCPGLPGADSYRTWNGGDAPECDEWLSRLGRPLIRRGFSIAGLAREPDGVRVEVIYRVVGTATRWMESLGAGESISVLGPLGNRFPIVSHKPVAWLAAGGVGLPPMLWLAASLHEAGKEVVAFCGARTVDLLPLTLDPSVPIAADAGRASLAAAEFARHQVPVVISTDDGSIGFRGYVGSALSTYSASNPTAGDEVVVYACGPEPMMRSVSDYCAARGIECYVCVERAMACGLGTCQSCVVEVHEPDRADGWRYRLCCTDGPVFDARQIIWDIHP